jgi:hypothetical protein
MKKRINFNSRYSLLFALILWFLSFSFLLRIVFFIWHFNEVSFGLIDVIKTFFTGFFFDIGVIVMITLPFTIYFTLMPNKFIGSVLDRILLYFFSILNIFCLFSLS